MSKQIELGQWMTPVWGSEEIVDLVGIRPDELVVEPSCGNGAFLKAIPKDIKAIGVEIDEELAEIARRDTGREVIVGDFREVELPYQPTLIIGNPPFQTPLVKDFINRGRILLPDGGRIVFILSTHIMQTSESVLPMLEGFGADHWIMPRTLFSKAERPLSLLQLTKGASHCRGMALYSQAYVFKYLPKCLKEPARTVSGVWLGVVTWAMTEAGGTADTKTLYKLTNPKRPTGTKWWREKIRQVLQQHFRPVARGTWTFKEPTHVSQNSD